MQMKLKEKRRSDYPRIEMPRRCATCKVVKPSAEFCANPRQKDGLHFYCRACVHIKDSLPKNRFSSARAAVTKAGDIWGFVIEEWEPRLKWPCHYCGGPIPSTGRGVDRIDPDGPYTMANTVPSCGLCNDLRGRIFTMDEMKIIGAAVAKIQDARVAAGLPRISKRAHKRRVD